MAGRGVERTEMERDQVADGSEDFGLEMRLFDLTIASHFPHFVCTQLIDLTLAKYVVLFQRSLLLRSIYLFSDLASLVRRA